MMKEEGKKKGNEFVYSNWDFFEVVMWTRKVAQEETNFQRVWFDNRPTEEAQHTVVLTPN